MTIRSLGYLLLEVRDPEAWGHFATSVLGMMPVQGREGHRRYRIDEQAWRVEVREGARDDVEGLGFEVADAGALEALRARLTAAGVDIEPDEPATAAARGVTGLLACRDPDGLLVEVYYGATERHEAPFCSPAGVSGFVTGEQGLGHVVLATRQMGETRRFYRDVLGFRLTDVIRMPAGPGRTFDLEFFRCNPRHHTIALAPVPAPKRLHHFMLQAHTLDEVGFALDRAAAAGAQIVQSLGRHTNDQMVSFYARTPAGFEVEFGFGGREIDDATWRVARHDSPSSWGHKPAVSAAPSA